MSPTLERAIRSAGSIQLDSRRWYDRSVTDEQIHAIEGVLAAHPSLRDAAVVAHTAEGEQRLVAYFVVDRDHVGRGKKIDWEAERTAQWQKVWDMAYYEPPRVEDPLFNTSAWVSSYSKMPVPLDEMRELLQGTVDRVSSKRPRQILEIGCGLGMVLFRLAPHCDRYWGTDFSEEALKYVEGELGRLNFAKHVSLLQRSADDLSGVDPVDAVILNSVVQYFPNIQYLLKVLRGGVERTREGGFVFVGDVRSLPLLPAFAASVEFYRAKGDVSVHDLRDRIGARVSNTTELVIDPAFFLSLVRLVPRITHVQICLRRGRHHNEMTRFRYDVIMQVDGPPAAQTPPPKRLDWSQDDLSLVRIQQFLQDERPDALHVSRIPNARLRREAEILNRISSQEHKTVADLRQSFGMRWLDPEDLWSSMAEGPYAVDLGWPAFGSNGSFEARFTRRGMEHGGDDAAVASSHLDASADLPALRDCANNPIAGVMALTVVPMLTDRLAEAFPGMPAPSFVLLEELPRLPDGRIDRRRLPSKPSGPLQK